MAGKPGIGVPELLDALVLCSLPPDKLPHKADEAGREVDAEAPIRTAPLVAQVFKTRIDPFVQRLSYMRDLFRHAEKGRDRTRLGARKPVKLHQLLRCKGRDRAGRRGRAGRHYRRGQDRGPAHRHWPGRFHAAALDVSDADGRAWPSRQKAAATKAKLSGALHKIVEEDRHAPARIAIRRPKSWS